MCSKKSDLKKLNFISSWPSLLRLIGVAWCFVTAACISVNVGPKPGERSRNVEYQIPAAPYQALKTSRADGAWQNKQNGNSISYFSTCGDSADPVLESVARELFSELKEPNTIRQTQTTFNGREALDTEVEGRVDGIVTRIRAVIFKKNDCTYTLSYIGVPKAFNEDRGRFDQFLKGFQAP